ncbi:hypothetical protein NC653_031315 [Populus alba x Populus x berolinensis]|uniref:Uncharacterized protein n=1 Tax=Populus alba x Populus x berolinensis TaxID=444605 RepID=A0AAD6Q182_9ROSI|nr:hypothetical protein NC653_031315 [Populus alba x Populus x berolinensis]
MEAVHRDDCSSNSNFPAQKLTWAPYHKPDFLTTPGKIDVVIEIRLLWLPIIQAHLDPAFGKLERVNDRRRSDPVRYFLKVELILFQERSRVSSALNFPRKLGIVPVNALWPSSSCASLLIPRGIGPVSRLLPSLS